MKDKQNETKPVIAVTDSLASKYRPKVIEDLVGQEGVKIQLEGMIKLRKFPASFLITGNSGVGKTTVARMIARYVNCDTMSACGECESCKRITHPDIFEVNVGDTRGIDDIRAIVGTATIKPRFNKRIIILDEVHGLTKPAATCLLVPIEKPSPDTIFILATTNPEKIMPTIVGRCHRLHLNTMTSDDMVSRLYDVAKFEGFNFKKIENGMESLGLIASLSNGQMRDALQILQSLIFSVSSGREIDPKLVMSSYIATSILDIEKQAAHTLFALLTYDLKSTLKYTIKADNPRQLLSKIRWLINYLLEVYAEVNDYQPMSARIFVKRTDKAAAAGNKLKIRYPDLLVLQSVLADTEVRMNDSSIDERILMTSAFGKFIKEIQ